MKHKHVIGTLTSACMVLMALTAGVSSSRSGVINNRHTIKSMVNKSIVNMYLKIEDSTEKTTIIRLNSNSTGTSWTGGFQSIGGTYKFMLADVKGNPQTLGTKSVPLTLMTTVSVSSMVNGKVTRGSNYKVSQGSASQYAILPTFTKLPAGIASITIVTAPIPPKTH